MIIPLLEGSNTQQLLISTRSRAETRVNCNFIDAAVQVYCQGLFISSYYGLTQWMIIFADGVLTHDPNLERLKGNYRGTFEIDMRKLARGNTSQLTDRVKMALAERGLISTAYSG